MMDYNRETVIYRDRCKKVIVEQLRLGSFYENTTFHFEISFWIDFLVGDRKTNDELEDIVDNNLRGDLRISVWIKKKK